MSTRSASTIIHTHENPAYCDTGLVTVQSLQQYSEPIINKAYVRLVIEYDSCSFRGRLTYISGLAAG